MNKKITKEQSNNSKTRILNSAVKLFAEKGYDAVSIREICRNAGANLCMVSYYWGGKKELYQGILDDLIEKQTLYAKQFIDFNKAPETLSKQEQIETVIKVLEKFVDFFYSNISKELIILLLKEQQNEEFKVKSPAFDYLVKLIACVFNKKENEREIIFKTLFIISQVNSARILPAFSLRRLGQDNFLPEDIKIIKENVKFYFKALLKESNIV